MDGPRQRPADDHVWEKRKQQCDDNCLGGIELPQHQDLVDRVHHKPEQDDPGSCIQAFVQPLSAFPRVGQHRPKIGRAAGPRVVEAMADGEDRHHQRLQDEAEAHRRVRPRNEIMPDALEGRDRNAVPYDAGEYHHKNERKNQFRQQA
jgi:hypothetical protein